VGLQLFERSRRLVQWSDYTLQVLRASENDWILLNASLSILDGRTDERLRLVGAIQFRLKCLSGPQRLTWLGIVKCSKWLASTQKVYADSLGLINDSNFAWGLNSAALRFEAKKFIWIWGATNHLRQVIFKTDGGLFDDLVATFATQVIVSGRVRCQRHLLVHGRRYLILWKAQDFLGSSMIVPIQIDFFLSLTWMASSLSNLIWIIWIDSFTFARLFVRNLSRNMVSEADLVLWPLWTAQRRLWHASDWILADLVSAFLVKVFLWRADSEWGL